MRIYQAVVRINLLIWRSMATRSCDVPSYQLRPLKFGAEVFGFDWKKNPSKEELALIKEDVHKYRLLVFRGQGLISGSRQVEISLWFGPLDSTFYQHPQSPHNDVFRISNDEAEGCRGVGRTGWHVDGSFQPAPFAFSIYHIHSVPKSGDTVFLPLFELLESLSCEQRARWERLWMMSDRRQSLVHPIVYPHPVTGYPTMCFHLGMTDAFVYDLGTNKERFTSPQETQAILKEMNEAICRNKHLQFAHKWQAGDFIISDNLAVGHEAHPDTQLSRAQVGLRVMHRTTVKGTKAPSKNRSEPPLEKYHPVRCMERLRNATNSSTS